MTNGTASAGKHALVETFLNPNSTLTPGASGAMTLLMTTVLGNIFGLPFAYTGLALSALFALLVLVDGVSLLMRGTYFVLNTLIIFCVAMGANTSALQFQGGLQRTDTSAWPAAISTAHAQGTATKEAAQEKAVDSVEKIASDPSLTPEEKLKAIQDQLNTAKSETPPAKASTRQFFQPWTF